MSVSIYDVNNKIHTHYTKGGEYSLSGVDYVGEYYLLNGKAYSGKSGDINAKELTKYYPNNTVYNYDNLFNFQKIESTYKQPKNSIIQPTEGILYKIL